MDSEKTYEVKILLVEKGDSCYECGGAPDSLLSFSDWETVSKEDFELLSKYVKYAEYKDKDWHGCVPVLVIKDPEPVAKRVFQIREYLDKKKIESEEKKKKAAERKALRGKIEEKKKRELLAQLKAELGEK